MHTTVAQLPWWSLLLPIWQSHSNCCNSSSATSHSLLCLQTNRNPWNNLSSKTDFSSFSVFKLLFPILTLRTIWNVTNFYCIHLYCTGCDSNTACIARAIRAFTAWLLLSYSQFWMLTLCFEANKPDEICLIYSSTMMFLTLLRCHSVTRQSKNTNH